jgi:membrane-associated phospholipid phosphatase
VAFTGAELLRREYGEEYPWVAVAGYAVAIAVGAMRICNNRHWLGDVLAGAGLGIMSVTLVYWALD